MNDDFYNDYRTATWPAITKAARTHGILACRMPVYMFLQAQCPETFGVPDMADVDPGAVLHLRDLSWKYRIAPEALSRLLVKVAEPHRVTLTASVLGMKWADEHAQYVAMLMRRQDRHGNGLDKLKYCLNLERESLLRHIASKQEPGHLSQTEAAREVLTHARSVSPDVLFRMAVEFGLHDIATAHMPGAAWEEQVCRIREEAWGGSLEEQYGRRNVRGR